MTKCSFCSREENDFMGVHLIKNDGSIDFFCTSKCRKNALKLKRDKRKLKWTMTYKNALKANVIREAAHEVKKAEDKKEAKKISDAKDVQRKASKEKKK